MKLSRHKYFYFAISLLLPVANLNAASNTVPCTSATPDLILRSIFEDTFSKDHALSAPVSTALSPATLIKSWKEDVLERLLNTTEGTGGKQLVKISQSKEHLDTVDWMISELKQMAEKAKASDAKHLTELEVELREFKKQAIASGNLDMREFFVKSTKFSNYAEDILKGVPVAPKTNQTILDEDLEVLITLIKHQPLAKAVPTHHPLTIRDFNDLSPYPIYPVGIVSKPTLADGTLYLPAEYRGHDVDHTVSMLARDKEILEIVGPNSFVPIPLRREKVETIIKEREALYKQFRNLVENEPDLEQKKLLDLIWFNLFHETPNLRFNKKQIAGALRRIHPYVKTKNELTIRILDSIKLDTDMQKEYGFVNETNLAKAIGTLLKMVAP